MWAISSSIHSGQQHRRVFVSNKVEVSSDPTTSLHGMCIPTFTHMCLYIHIYKHHVYKHMYTHRQLKSFFFFLSALHSPRLKHCHYCVKNIPSPSSVHPVLLPLSLTGVNDFLVPCHSPHVSLHFQHISTCDLCKKAVRLYHPPLNLRLFHVFALNWRETLHPFPCSFPNHLPLRSYMPMLLSVWCLCSRKMAFCNSHNLQGFSGWLLKTKCPSPGFFHSGYLFLCLLILSLKLSWSLSRQKPV